MITLDDKTLGELGLHIGTKLGLKTLGMSCGLSSKSYQIFYCPPSSPHIIKSYQSPDPPPTPSLIT